MVEVEYEEGKEHEDGNNNNWKIVEAKDDASYGRNVHTACAVANGVRMVKIRKENFLVDKIGALVSKGVGSSIQAWYESMLDWTKTRNCTERTSYITTDLMLRILHFRMSIVWMMNT